MSQDDGKPEGQEDAFAAGLSIRRQLSTTTEVLEQMGLE